MNRMITSFRLLVMTVLLTPALLSCGGGGGVGGGPGTTPGNNAADFVAAFEGFDSANRRLSLTLTPTDASRGQVTGTFNAEASRMNVYDPTAIDTSQNIEVSGTFDGQNFSITLASASAPLGTAYTGRFVDQHTIEIRSGGGAPLTLRRNGYFFPSVVGNWSGTASGQPWVLQFGLLDGYETSDSTSRIVGTELRGGRTSRVTGFLNVRNVRLTIERAGGTVTIDGVFPMNGTTVNANSIDLGAQGVVTRGGAPDTARVLYRLEFDGALSSVDLFGNQSTVVVGSSASPRIYDAIVSPDKTHVAYWRQEGVGEDLWIARLSDGSTRRITSQGDSGFTYWGGAQWSPSGSHFAYATRSSTTSPFNIWVVSTDGMPPVALTSNTAVSTGLPEMMLAWGPDVGGTPQLAFIAAESAGGDRTHLYLQRFDESSRVQLTPTLAAGQHVRSMAWSPDGQQIAFVGNVRIATAWELFVASGTSVATQILPQLESGRSVSIYHWSPNSQRLAFISNAPGAGINELSVVARDSTTSQVVSDFAGGPYTNQSMFDFSWSPDSSKLAVIASLNSLPTQMYVAAADGTGNPVMVSDGSQPVHNYNTGQWSPDSARVAFSVQAGPESQSLVSANASGTSRIQLATGVATACQLDFAWSPNGNQMAFVRQLSSGDCALHAVDADGANAHALESPARGSANVYGFTWWPDSKRILYLSSRNSTFVGSELFVAYANGNSSLEISGSPAFFESVALFQPL